MGNLFVKRKSKVFLYKVTLFNSKSHKWNIPEQYDVSKGPFCYSQKKLKKDKPNDSQHKRTSAGTSNSWSSSLEHPAWLFTAVMAELLGGPLPLPPFPGIMRVVDQPINTRGLFDFTHFGVVDSSCGHLAAMKLFPQISFQSQLCGLRARSSDSSAKWTKCGLWLNKNLITRKQSKMCSRIFTKQIMIKKSNPLKWARVLVQKPTHTFSPFFSQFCFYELGG